MDNSLATEDQKIRPNGRQVAYDGFISYSHAADGLLAPRLQAGLQRFAKPWWKRRAVRIFRDESSLSANPHLWSSITDALDSSGWFVLLLSPDAAASEWVNQEIAYWKTNRDPSRILPVVTDGEFGWADGDVTGDAVPEELRGVFPEEPRWVDLRFARGEEQFDLKNPRFSAVVADIASALRGVPKDELESEEVRQHRNTIRTAWAAGGLVTVLAIAAVGFGIQSARNASEAERQTEIALQNEQQAEANAVEADTQRLAAESSEAEAVLQAAIARSRELGASAVEALEGRFDPKLAALLALESLHVGGPLGEQPTTIVDTLFRAVSTDRLVDIIETGTQGLVHIALSPEDGRLVASSEDSGWVRMYSVPDGSLLWEFSEDTSDTFTLIHFHPDGTRLAVGVSDSEAYDRRLMDPDDLPARILILDADTGDEIRRLSSAPCTAVDPWGWSPDGRFFVIATGLATCQRPGTTSGTWAEILDGDTFESVRLFDVDDPRFGVRAKFSDSGDLFLHGFETPTVVYRSPEYDAPEQIDNTNGFNAPSPDGRLVTSFDPGSAERFTLVDVESGQRIDVLRPLTSNPSLPQGVTFSPDGSQVIAQTEGEGTLIWDVFSGQQLFVLPARGRGNPVMTADGQTLYTSHADGQIRTWTLQPITIGQTVVGDLEGFDWVNANGFSVGPSIGAAEAFRLGEDFEGRTVFFDPDSGTIDHVLEGFVAPDALTDGKFAVFEMGGGEWVYDPATGDREHIAECFSSDTEPPLLCDDTGEEKVFVSRIISLDRSQILYVHETDRSELSQPAPPFFEIVDAETLEVVVSGAWDFDFEPVLTFTDEWIAGYTAASSKLVVVDWTTGDEIARFLNCACRTEISPSGRIYAGIEETRLTFVDLEDWGTRTYDLGLGSIRGMAFSPDDSVLLLGAAEEILFVDVEEGDIFRRLPVPDISDFHWIDDETVLIGNREGLWATLTLDPFELAAATLTNLTRGFEPDECETYGIDPCPSTLESVRERYGRLGR